MSKQRLWDFLSLILGVGLAIGLFFFGLGFDNDLRLVGDAQEYLRISATFQSLIDAVTFVGVRSIGMPLFDWLFPNPNSICVALLLIHLFAIAYFIRFIYQSGFFKSRWSYRFLFVFLVSYPALIGHTTTPLTDTISIDLSLLVFILLYQRTLSANLISGVLAAFMVFLRPAYLIPTTMALAFFALVSLYRQKNWKSPAIVILIYGILLGSYSYHCGMTYGKLCLQDPTTFEPVKHAQMGLRGGRLLWGQRLNLGGEFPVVQDSILTPNFYDQCHLKSIVGFGDDSLSGCLMRRPHLLPAYAVKKWIGLFDNFRFQPFLEDETPDWLVVWSRLFNTIAFVGFAFLILSLGKVRKLDVTSQAYLVFFALLLAQHTILHPEDRFGLVLVPLSGLGFVSYLKSLKETSSKPKQVALITFGVVVATLFIWQIVVWDNTVLAY